MTPQQQTRYSCIPSPLMERGPSSSAFFAFRDSRDFSESITICKPTCSSRISPAVSSLQIPTPRQNKTCYLNSKHVRNKRWLPQPRKRSSPELLRLPAEMKVSRRPAHRDSEPLAPGSAASSHAPVTRWTRKALLARSDATVMCCSAYKTIPLHRSKLFLFC